VVARAETTCEWSCNEAKPLSKAEHDKLSALCGIEGPTTIALSAPAPTNDGEASITATAGMDATLASLLANWPVSAQADPDAGDTRLYLKLKALVYLPPKPVCRSPRCGAPPRPRPTMHL